MKLQRKNYCLKYELIDTLWNVNLLSCKSRRPALRFRINRYIMECKFNLGFTSKSPIIELIDTLWNVN